MHTNYFNIGKLKLGWWLYHHWRTIHVTPSFTVACSIPAHYPTSISIRFLILTFEIYLTVPLANPK